MNVSPVAHAQAPVLLRQSACRPGKNYFEISDECIDCGECEAECGFNAILIE